MANGQAQQASMPQTIPVQPYLDLKAFDSWIGMSSSNGEYEYSDILNSCTHLSDFCLAARPVTPAQIQDMAVAINNTVVPMPNTLNSNLVVVPNTVKMQAWLSNREDHLQYFISHGGSNE